MTAPLVLKDKAKLWHGIANFLFGGAFPGPPASLDDYPDIVNALSEVWYNKKPLAVITAAFDLSIAAERRQGSSVGEPGYLICCGCSVCDAKASNDKNSSLQIL